MLPGRGSPSLGAKRCGTQGSPVRKAAGKARSSDGEVGPCHPPRASGQAARRRLGLGGRAGVSWHSLPTINPLRLSLVPRKPPANALAKLPPFTAGSGPEQQGCGGEGTLSQPGAAGAPLATREQSEAEEQRRRRADGTGHDPAAPGHPGRRDPQSAGVCLPRRRVGALRIAGLAQQKAETQLHPRAYLTARSFSQPQSGGKPRGSCLGHRGRFQKLRFTAPPEIKAAERSSKGTASRAGARQATSVGSRGAEEHGLQQPSGSPQSIAQPERVYRREGARRRL